MRPVSITDYYHMYPSRAAELYVEKRYIDRVCSLLPQKDCERFLLSQGYRVFSYHLSTFDETMLYVFKTLGDEDLLLTHLCFSWMWGRNALPYSAKVNDSYRWQAFYGKQDALLPVFSYPVQSYKYWGDLFSLALSRNNELVFFDTHQKVQATYYHAIGSLSPEAHLEERCGTWKACLPYTDTTVLKFPVCETGPVHVLVEWDEECRKLAPHIQKAHTWLHPLTYAFGIPVVEQEKVTMKTFTDLLHEFPDEDLEWVTSIDRCQAGVTEDGRVVSYDFSLSTIPSTIRDTTMLATVLTEDVNVRLSLPESLWVERK